MKYQFPMGKVEELSKSLIWLTTPMLVVARCACAGTPVRYAFAPLCGSSSPQNAGHFGDPVFPKKRSILANADWLRATAKESKFKCTFQNRTSIPYGKGKAAVTQLEE